MNGSIPERSERKKSAKTLKGFSLGEVLLTIFVLVVGILPVFTSLSRSLALSSLNHRVVVASGLAQEGIELVKNVKDNAVLAEGRTLSTWIPDYGNDFSCRIDFDDGVLGNPSEKLSCESTPVSGAGTSDFYALSEFPSGSSAGMWAHRDTDGPYRRMIFVSYDRTAEEGVCLSTVFWGSYAPSDIDDVRADCRPDRKCVYTETLLTPWRK